jgi:hypothetical protein
MLIRIPVKPTWAVGALFRGARCIHIIRVCFHIPLSLRSQSILDKGNRSVQGWGKAIASAWESSFHHMDDENKPVWPTWAVGVLSDI